MKFNYKGNSINSVESLAQVLAVSLPLLVRLSREADKFYIEHAKLKSNGKPRKFYSVKQPLSMVQESILNKIILDVQFPNYLHGSIKDRENPRSEKGSAQFHVGARILVQLDIKDFFPSISYEIVKDIWQNFFGFSLEVSSVLASLTTCAGLLPQGACTSSALSNLVFWDLEPELVQSLAARGYYYGRYVDDITLSKREFVSLKALDSACKSVSRMLSARHLKMNRGKTDRSTSREQMKVHSLNINSGRATIPKPERDRIRTAVYHCEQFSELERTSDEYENLWLSTTGRAQRLKEFHPQEGKPLLDRLNCCRPLVSKDLINYFEQQLQRYDRIVHTGEFSNEEYDGFWHDMILLEQKLQFCPALFGKFRKNFKSLVPRVTVLKYD